MQSNKCPNFVVCGGVNPECMLFCESKLCLTCEMAFGRWKDKKGDGELKQMKNMECNICMEVSLCLKQAYCTHHLCVDCFKHCYFSFADVRPPQHPYPPRYTGTNERDTRESHALAQVYMSDVVDYKKTIHQNKKSARCPFCRADGEWDE